MFGVHYCLLAGYARSRRCSRPSQPDGRCGRSRRGARRSRCGTRSWYGPQLAVAAHVAVAADTAPAAPRLAARGSRSALVDTSVNLKPTELVDVALDMLARLTPCLNLGVGKLGHKDLLDTIDTDNCRK